VVAQRRDPVRFLERLSALRPDFDADSWRGDWLFVADARFAWVCTSDRPPSSRCQLNDMSLDPDWERDASLAHPDARARLAAAGERLPRFPTRHSEPGSPELQEPLRALGYVE
jgi:hypothetical protein